jgi:hypothetical protein
VSAAVSPARTDGRASRPIAVSSRPAWARSLYTGPPSRRTRASAFSRAAGGTAKDFGSGSAAGADDRATAAAQTVGQVIGEAPG